MSGESGPIEVGDRHPSRLMSALACLIYLSVRHLHLHSVYYTYTLSNIHKCASESLMAENLRDYLIREGGELPVFRTKS